MKDSVARNDRANPRAHPQADGARNAHRTALWHEHSLIDLILTACDESDDQAEIGSLVEDQLREVHPRRRQMARKVPARRAFPEDIRIRAA